MWAGLTRMINKFFRPNLFSVTLGFIRQTRDVIHISAKNRIMQGLCFQSPRLKLYIHYSSRIKYNHLYFLVGLWKKWLMRSGNLRAPPSLEKGPRIWQNFVVTSPQIPIRTGGSTPAM